ncbi:MAG TPA: GIY-YIG nuclease family protein [Nitrospinota bacterium]|nr:GIY-YIG nuclease family protein [Nitrospinota bacterium]
MLYYVYILHCSDGHLYYGCTGNLSRRLQLHHQEKSALPSHDSR